MLNLTLNNLKTLTLAAGVVAACNAHASIEEIIVAVQKRDQSTYEVPLSVSAIGAQQLALHPLDNPEDIARFTPGFNARQMEANFISYTVRGITSSEVAPSAAPRIGIYLNGADISRNRAAGIELYDLAQIEVVKGPQNSLFGTTASAGAVSIVTNPPQQDFAAQAKFEVGRFDRKAFEGMVTGGNEVVQGRLAAYALRRDGYRKNLLTNKGLGSRDRDSVRGSLRFIPVDDWQLDAVIIHERANDISRPEKSATIAPVGGNTSPFSASALNGSNIDIAGLGANNLRIHRQTDDLNLRLQGQLGAWQLNALSAWRRFDVSTPSDADGSQVWAFALQSEADGEQSNQELRLSLAGDNFDLMLGASYFKEDGHRAYNLSVEEGSYLLCVPLARNTFSRLFDQFAGLSTGLANAAAALNPNTGLPCTNTAGVANSITPIATSGAVQQLPYLAGFDDYGNNRSASVYADVSWDITEHWQLNAGLRAIDEKRQSAFSATVPNGVLTQGLVPLVTLGDTAGQKITAGNSDSEMLWRANLRYQISDKTFAYGAYSEGRRSAVTDISSALDSTFQPSTSINQVPAELLRNYELGLKSQADKWSYSVALFYQRYSDYQVSFLTNAAQFTVSNVGKSNNPGIEIEGRYAVNEHWQVFANATHFDNRFDDNVSNQNFADKLIEDSVAQTATLGLEYNHQWRSYPVRAALVGSYQSELAFDGQRQPIEPVSGLSLIQGGYTVWYLSTNIELSDSLSASMWIKNLTDKRYLLDASTIGNNIGLPVFTAAEPRTWSLALSYKF
mgnify:CR=1 FL=1